MPPRKTTQDDASRFADYRHDATRKNNPSAAFASQGRVNEIPKKRYRYDPHLPPTLRFDDSGESDRLPELLAESTRRRLTEEEAKTIADALANRQPWLEWTGKRERRWFEVDPVALHIHERVSALAAIRIAARRDAQRQLWADPEQAYHEAVQFYKHEVPWANRLVLGDSLAVMNSLSVREDMAGKVQMIYVDPPYGINYQSNFQPVMGNRRVKDRDADLTREPEVVKAYRDTWNLGVHSYLAYLRDRLTIARDLLTDSGSIFVQIGDENVHNVRAVMDEVFGKENFVREIIFTKTTNLGQSLLNGVNDYILWYAKSIDFVKYRPYFTKKVAGAPGASRYTRKDSGDESVYATTDLRSQSGGENSAFTVHYNGRDFTPGNLFWKTNQQGMSRIANAGRVLIEGNTLRFKRYLTDFPVVSSHNVWTDVGGIQSRSDPKIYVVQTTNKVIQRCMLMTTDPGDLVLDPTCGSGTTAYVAEQWGRRWITIDTSRVAIALTRQRLLTATFKYYETKGGGESPADGFEYKSVPHITLRSIAQNSALDPIFAKWDAILDEKLAALNGALAAVGDDVRAKLRAKLARRGGGGGGTENRKNHRRRRAPLESP